MAAKGALRSKVGKAKVNAAKPTPAEQRAIDRLRRSFAPFRPPSAPPPGTYDPALDAQLRASERGLADVGEDYRTGGTRRFDDFQLGLGDLGRQRDEGLADLLRRRDEIGLSYRRLGNSQAQAAASANMTRGGALLQAARKRVENEKYDLKPVETAETRTREGYDRGVGELTKQYSRSSVDADTALERARREAGQFGLDVGEQRFFQAEQGGYEGPVKPKGEMTRYGQTFRVAGLGKPVAQRQYTLMSGRQLNRNQFVKRARKWKAAM
jgi:hypothetical protein